MLARILATLMALALLASGAMATPPAEDADWGHVSVDILPTVRVTYLGGDLTLPDADALDQICATLEFEVHANGQDIALQGGASKLFKDDNPGSQFWIPVDVLTPAVITAAYGENHSGLPTIVNNFDMGVFGVVQVWHTDWLEYGSGDAGTWSYNVTVYICWQGDNAELFQGDYSGGVILWGMYVGI